MRRVREEAGYLIDPHTAVGSFVARKANMAADGVPCVIAATATPHKFPETCKRAFGGEVLGELPPAFSELFSLPEVQDRICDVGEMDSEVRRLFTAGR